jgi:hypothetical protein
MLYIFSPAAHLHDVRASDRVSPAMHWQFAWYNAVLRQFPKELFEKIGSFTTTIFVLVSAVQKIARVMKLPEGLKLYRGMGGLMDLPGTFFQPDEQGRKGYLEWAFMSTTSDIMVGCVYAGTRCSRGEGVGAGVVNTKRS